MQIIRGGMLLIATLCYFGALSYIPMTDALAISFVAPLIVTIISPFFLGEKVGVLRISAVLIGFLGVLIIIRPGMMEINIGTLLPLGTGMSYAVFAILTRKLAGSAPPVVTLTFTAFLGTLVLAAVMPFFWVMPNMFEWLLLLGMGICGAAGHYFLIKAYNYAEASFLAPFSYIEIIATTILGFIVFGDFPDLWTWVGSAVVIASGIFISYRERVKHAPMSDDPVPPLPIQ